MKKEPTFISPKTQKQNYKEEKHDKSQRLRRQRDQMSFEIYVFLKRFVECQAIKIWFCQCTNL